MTHEPTTQKPSYGEDSILYMAFELSAKTWRVLCSAGSKKRSGGTMVPGDDAGLKKLVERAKKKLGLPTGAHILSCCEAGRDGFWVHRFLEKHEIKNVVVDAASMKVNRKGRRAKTDKIDVRHLLNELERYHRGDEEVWKVVHVPSPEDEDDRRVHRELERLKKERAQHITRIKSLLATQGVRVENLSRFLDTLDEQKIWNGDELPQHLKEELDREGCRLLLIESQISMTKRSQQERVKAQATEKEAKIQKVMNLRGIGLDSAWMLIMEHFGWRKFNNRREVGGSVGLGGTPYDSGDTIREQGISKDGNKRIRSRLVELSWLWIRYQPESDITLWYKKRFANGGKRMRRIGIVGVARRLLIEIWHYVEHDVEPKGAIIAKS